MVTEVKGWRETSRGRGRVLQCTNDAAYASSKRKQLASISHSDAQHGEKPGDPPPPYDRRLVEGWLEYVDMESPKGVNRGSTAVHSRLSVLLRGTPLVSRLAGVWGFDGLAQSSAFFFKDNGQAPHIYCSDAEKHRFMEIDELKNCPGGPYYCRQPETDRLLMDVDEFVQSARAWQTRKLRLKAALCNSSTNWEKSRSSHLDRSLLCSNTSTLPLGEEDRLRADIDWAWITAFQRAYGFEGSIEAHIEAGCRGGILPTRYYLHNQLIAQIAGRRRVLIIPASKAFQGLYPYPVAHPYDRYSMVDLEKLDSVRWPGCCEVRGQVAILRPGDVLYVPAFTFLLEQDLEEENVVLRTTIHGDSGTSSKAADELRVSRVIEERAAISQSVGSVRRWLVLIGAEKEMQHINLETASGFKCAVMCQTIRDEIEHSLGRAAWCKFLQAMCYRRLGPTPWLNDNIRDPLLLSDGPETREDIRTEEEQRYPTLFMRR